MLKWKVYVLFPELNRVTRVGCVCVCGYSLCPYVKGNELSGGMNASAQHISQEEASLLYGAKRASSAASAENSKENSYICPQICKDASLLCPVHENTSVALICFRFERNYLRNEREQ